jgi:hypothetical protein
MEDTMTTTTNGRTHRAFEADGASYDTLAGIVVRGAVEDRLNGTSD